MGVIGPGIDDVDHASDEEIIAAYLGMHFTDDDARTYLAQLRNHDPRYSD